MYRIHQLDLTQHLSELVNFEAVSQVLPMSVVQAVIAECGVAEQRRRKLPAVLGVWRCILLNIFSGIGLHWVLVRMVRGTRLLAGAGLEVTANKSAISKGRYRLGVASLEALFKRVCGPLATPDTPGAFR